MIYKWEDKEIEFDLLWNYIAPHFSDVVDKETLNLLKESARLSQSYLENTFYKDLFEYKSRVKELKSNYFEELEKLYLYNIAKKDKKIANLHKMLGTKGVR